MKLEMSKLIDNTKFQKLQIGLLIGGTFLSLVEIRFEHQAVLADKWQSWIPIVYLSTMLFLCLVSILTFQTVGRKLLVLAFAGLIVLGFLGFAFHSQGKPFQRLASVITIDFSPPGQLTAGDNADIVPPLLAPLSLVGLGAIGILCSLWKSQ